MNGFHPDARVTERRLHFVPNKGQLVGADRPRPDGFIKGPLPLGWMTRAAHLPGKTLQVALALWYLSGLQKSDSVTLASKVAERFGISRDAKYDGLARLVEAGLIFVVQSPGRAPVVTLLRQPPACDA